MPTKVRPTKVRDDAVRLSLPATREYVRLVRLAAAGIATNLGFDVDELDDLRVGVGELTNLTLDVCEPVTLEVVFTIVDNELRIEGVAPAAEGRALEIDSITRLILEAVVDRYSIEIAGGEVRFTCARRPL